MKGLWLLAAGTLLPLVLSGCRSTATPDWAHPGSACAQEKRALRYDPYPENEPGPVLEGVRPPGYEKPPPEPSRARWEKGGWGQ